LDNVLVEQEAALDSMPPEPDKSDPSPEEERRIELLKQADAEEGKLDHYFTGLIFTVLALAIQTAKPISPILDTVQLIAIIVLLAAGIVSLVRLERRPRLLRHQFETLGHRGGRDLQAWSAAQTRENDLRRRQGRDYKLQRTLFIVACGLLACCRTPIPTWLHCGG